MKGFTLMELMITLVIVAILAAIAIPNYSAYVRKARRNDAREAVMHTAALLEKHMLSNNVYTAVIADIQGASTSSEGGYYTIAVANTAGNDWRVTATASSGTQLNDTDCQTFTYHLDGRRTATASNSSDSTARCWD